MRNNYLLLLLVYVFSINLYAQAPGCANVKGGDVNGNPVATICNPGECRQIKATYLETGGTNTYTVSPIPYAPPFPFVGGNAIPIIADDDWSQIINLGFKFCFFNQSYTKALICDNGALSFSIAGAGGTPGGLYTPGSDSGYSFNTPIPQSASTVPYRNAVFGVLQDLNPVVSPANHSSALPARSLAGRSRRRRPPAPPLARQRRDGHVPSR
ncbi:MAG: hypothetical protein E2604_02495, partial [Flavobacterium sp.]|nr:hypothetical protein [Flavobacterium sp.]